MVGQIGGESAAALAAWIDGPAARAAQRQFDDLEEPQRSYAVVLCAAYPAMAPQLHRDPHLAPASAQPAPQRLRAAHDNLEQVSDGTVFRRELRLLALRERMRIALREVLPAPLGGADLEVTARELSYLADHGIEAALREAQRDVFRRYGPPLHDDGKPGRIAVLGMGKLGGRELNAGSDVDLVCFYDTDRCRGRKAGIETSAHQIWTKVVQRMTANLAELTEDGLVWRVDLRLRPEGGSGALVNSLAAAERYYETFGRLWERAAWLRARPVAGDRAFGNRVLRMLEPFVWRSRVDPQIANTMYDLVHRARDELSTTPERDLKLGPGGIREAEFFVQTLQLIWGGPHPRVRTRSTVQSAWRLRAAGLMTEREARDLVAAYLALRRTEHAVQFASGVQTHDLPEELETLARTLGYADARTLQHDLDGHTTRVGELLRSLLPEGAPQTSRWDAALEAIARGAFEPFEAELSAAGMPFAVAEHAGELARDLFEMARHPDSPLGVRSREQWRHLPDTFLDALADAADPIQAARYCRGFVMRVRPVSLYSKLLAEDPSRIRRLITALGGSAFLAEAVAARPELADLVMFESRAPDRATIAREVEQAVSDVPIGDIELCAGALRRAKNRITTQIALADLGGEVDTAAVTDLLSALADAILEEATRHVLGSEEVRGLCVIAMGKLGGREIGYGSDLDVIFLYRAAEDCDDPVALYSRYARRIIQLITMPHPEGRGYELDTRLRPSGRQGLLVVSLDAFARYHATGGSKPGERAATWERLALLRARIAAGDRDVGEEAMRIAQRATYEAAHDDRIAGDIRHLRDRMERELAAERPGRYDLKFGRGGLVDVEFTTQLLQLRHGGTHPEVRTSDTRGAIEALARERLLTAEDADALRSGYAFLRRLEQRIRIVHGTSEHLIEENAAGLEPLARRMGLRDLPGAKAASALLERYRLITDRVRATYERLVGGQSASRFGVGSTQEPVTQHILIAEDDDLVRSALELTITRMGMATTCVDDGVAAWAALEAKDYDLLIADLAMPGLSGFELTERLRASRPNANILLMSGNVTQADTLRAEQLATPLLLKPFGLAELRQAIEAALED